MNKFTELIRHIHSEHVYIQTHNFPDPDAIASAYGLSVLLEKYGFSSSICYQGKIERFSTNGFIEKLGIKLTSLDELHEMIETDEIILVDSQKGNANITDAIGNEIICIDHHPSYNENNSIQYRYSDIRPEIGACATIIASYFIENNIEIDTKVATALLYGIKSDTMGLSRGVSPLDVDVYRLLFSICNMDIIQALEHCSLKFADLKAFANAINSIKIYDNISFANAGYNCPEALIATVSDFMLDLIEVDFSVVYSIKDDGIKLSVRSQGEIDAGIVTNIALSGIGSGGGHASMAGGFVPFAEEKANVRALTGVVEERFLKVISQFQKKNMKNGL